MVIFTSGTSTTSFLTKISAKFSKKNLLLDLVTNYGIPVAVYSDRHTLFFSPKDREDKLTIEQQLLGEQQSLTQIGRILKELGIHHIPANSPQAKGRIERFFKTLQERLLIELRLKGASNIDEANQVLAEFIPKYNAKFAVPPLDNSSAFRPVPSHLRLEHIFCLKYLRKLNSGYTISFGRKTYKVLNPPKAPFIPLHTVVDVHVLSDGSLFVGWNGHIYPVEPLEPTHPKTTTAKTKSTGSPKAEKETGSTPRRRPAEDHPWRKPWTPRRPNYTSSSALTDSQTTFP